MSADIFSPVVTGIAAILVAVVTAVITYGLTKKREREAELRKEKLEHYKEFASALSGIVSPDDTPEGHRQFAKASNKLNLIAPQDVIVALQDFRSEISRSNMNPSKEMHDKLMSRLFYEMRKDLNISPKDHLGTFAVGVWNSGQPAVPSSPTNKP